MKVRGSSRFAQSSTACRAQRLPMKMVLLVVAACMSIFAQAQAPSSVDQSKNITYIHPPENAPALKLNKDALHPPPQPYAGPKSPAAKTVNRGPLPNQMPAGMYQENTENLIRNWKNRRPMKERQKAAEE